MAIEDLSLRTSIEKGEGAEPETDLRLRTDVDKPAPLDGEGTTSFSGEATRAFEADGEGTTSFSGQATRGFEPAGDGEGTTSFDGDGDLHFDIDGQGDTQFDGAGDLADFDQEGYRFRNDDGSETTATWLQAQDANITREKEVNTRLRVLTDNDRNPAAQTETLQYKRDDEPDSEWRDIPV